MNEACYGGAIYNENGTSPIMTNCILWNDTGFQGSDEIYGCNNVTYCDVDGGWQGNGNINVNPSFRDPALDDFHLTLTACGDASCSPCIDVGSPNINDEISDCMHGLNDSRSDMGAYGGHNARWGGETGINEPLIPWGMALLQNYPNPFNAQTDIDYNLPEAGFVNLSIFNLIGQKVVVLFEGWENAGIHRIAWNAQTFASGVYFARLQARGINKNIKMLLLR